MSSSCCLVDVVKSGTAEAERLVEASNRRRLKTIDCPVRRKKNVANGEAMKSEWGWGGGGCRSGASALGPNLKFFVSLNWP